MRVDRIPVGEVGAREVAAWRELAAVAVEPNPFLEPECVLPAARFLGGSRVALLVVADGRDWVACLPVTHGLRVHGRRLPVLTGWRHLYSFLGTPLVARSSVAEGCRGLLEAAFGATRVPIFALPWLGEDGPVAAAMTEALAEWRRPPLARRGSERPVIDRAAVAPGIDGLLGHDHRRDLHRLERRLAEQLDAPVATRDVSELASAVDGFLALEARGWKGRRGTALDCRGDDAAFFRELCSGFRSAGRLQLLSFGSGERAVSYKCNLLAGDAVFHFKIAYDEEFARFRPGLQLEVQTLERFRNTMDAAWMDSCASTGNGPFGRLWPGRRRLASYILSPLRLGSLASGRAPHRRPRPRPHRLPRPERAGDGDRAARGRAEAARLLPVRLVVHLNERAGAPA